MIFTDRDNEFLQSKGISKEKIEAQVAIFKKGIPYVNLVASATPGNGICVFSEDKKQHYIQLFEDKRESLDFLKFVPASGAASRMFKSLFNFVLEFNPKTQSVETYSIANNAPEIKEFFNAVKLFPFYEEIIRNIKDFNGSEEEKKHRFVKELLLEYGLAYGNYPKGLLPFHQYKTNTITAFEEHLYEAALYSETKGAAKLHFTISEAHQTKFETTLNQILTRVEKHTQVQFKVSFSYQKTATDTVAVTLDNTLFRNDDQSLLFRPSGHGALIENLNEHDADIIFIKNIDNVVVEKYRTEVCDAKKMLAGKLIEVQEEVFKYAKLLDEQIIISKELSTKIKTFLEDQLNVSFNDSFINLSLKQQQTILKDSIDRPIRICGMVKNEGEPGGGPFWVKDENGKISLQIIEAAQIDTQNKLQQTILKESTHFNPVDLVCGVRNYKGEKYNLTNFVDVTQGFITQKTSQGRDLKALELPGLWNGAMAYWNTIFVEVPLITFNPVKTVNDLLKDTHQVVK